MKYFILLALVSFAIGQNRHVPSLDGRIVGGHDVNIADYPYQISLQLMSSHYCGGAIISSTWILTAGHCVEDVPIPLFFSVRAGSTTKGSGGAVYSVIQVISHPNYDSFTMDYDIALLQLSAPISTSNARPIALAQPGNGPAANSVAILTGWGILSEGGSSPTILQMVEVPVVSLEDCRNAYYQSTYDITVRMFCAGYLGVGGKDACQGDSGGPVVVDGLLVGLVSWGRGCARPEYPGVYTNLAAVRDWITTNSGV